ncbi:MAG: hypothetical protein J0I09_01840 [Sphingobacteriia bacterium]|nr:hypothetical protein [Sphingobacteriia bacterium]
MQHKAFIYYVIKFIAFFLFFYVGTYCYIGITSPGGYYFPYLDHYFNYVNWLRSLLLNGAKAILQILGFEGNITDKYHLQINHANSVQLVYACLGYGVISFWFAFVITSSINTIHKIKWMLAGFLLIVFSNMLRLAILLIAIYKGWTLWFNLEHHFVYNVIAYGIVGLLCWGFLKREDK